MAVPPDAPPMPAAAPRGLLERWADSDVWHSFTQSWLTMAAAAVTALLVIGAALAPLVAPHDPFDLASLSVLHSEVPPAWEKNGQARFLLGTDNQGRDMLSAILYGMRISLFVGV